MSIIEEVNEAKALEVKQKPKGSGKKTVKIGAYEINDKGVFLAPPDDTPKVWICARLEVLARTRDKDGGNWGVLVSFTDHDGTEREVNIKNESLSSDSGGDVIKQLAGLGLDIGSGPKAKFRLVEYLQRVTPDKRADLVYSLGWHDGRFLWPCGYISGGRDKSIVYYEQGRPINPAFVNGTLEEWRSKVPLLCRGNSRFMFSLSVSFAAPLLAWVNMNTAGFHFVGDSSQGKSTLLEVASSVYGRPKDKDRGDYLHTWRATDNGLEGIAKAYSGFMLPLDELKQLDARIAGETVYMLGNGAGKSRATDSGLGKPVATWQLLFLSTGEKTLAEHMSSVGKTPDAGAEVRMITITSDAGKGMGMFEELHGFGDGPSLSATMKKVAHQSYGSAGRAFVERLVEGFNTLPLELKSYIEHFISNHLPANASGQVVRVASYFALSAKAGEWAAEWGLTGWDKGEAEAAAITCFKSWLSHRGGVGSHEDMTALKQVQLFFEMNGDSAFKWVNRIDDDHAPNTVNRYGFRENDPAYEGVVYYVLPEMFKILCKGFNYTKVARMLADKGALLRDGKNLTRKKQIIEKGKRFYVLTSKVFSLTDDAAIKLDSSDVEGF